MGLLMEARETFCALQKVLHGTRGQGDLAEGCRASNQSVGRLQGHTHTSCLGIHQHRAVGSIDAAAKVGCQVHGGLLIPHECIRLTLHLYAAQLLSRRRDALSSDTSSPHILLGLP